jgi:hypothetical protein
MPSVQSSYPNEAEVTRIAATEDAAARNRQITEAYWKATGLIVLHRPEKSPFDIAPMSPESRRWP